MHHPLASTIFSISKLSVPPIWSARADTLFTPGFSTPFSRSIDRAIFTLTDQAKNTQNIPVNPPRRYKLSPIVISKSKNAVFQPRLVSISSEVRPLHAHQNASLIELERGCLISGFQQHPPVFPMVRSIAGIIGVTRSFPMARTIATMNFKTGLNQFTRWRMKTIKKLESREGWIKRVARHVRRWVQSALMRAVCSKTSEARILLPLRSFFLQRLAWFWRCGLVSETFQFLILFCSPLAIRYAVQAGQATGQQLFAPFFGPLGRSIWPKMRWENSASHL